MKRILSTALAMLMLLSSFSFSAFAASGEIAIQAETLNNVLASFGIKAAAKTQLLQGDAAPDGITAVKVNPDPCEDRDPKYNVECRVLLECYPTGLEITPATYKYARLTYKYVPASSDTNTYSPEIEFRTKATGFKTYTSTDTLQANKWATIDFDITGTDYAADDIISQLRVSAFGKALGTLDYEGGSYNADSVTLANPDSTLYIANLAFFLEKPGTPKVTGISFASETATVTRDKSIVLPKVIVTGEYSPITSYDLVLSGHTSEDTYISADGLTLYAGADEESDTLTLTATSVADSSFKATLTITVTDPAPRSKFDADNVVLSFGVVSDIHLSGSWNQPRSKAKWSHVIDIFQNLGADAILMNGDLTDAIASAGNVSGGGLHTDKNGNGTKADQNFREVGYVAQAMWGEKDGGYGNGTNDTTKMFYVLGNHDEYGEGISNAVASRSFSKVYSAEYFAAVICGWQYDNTSEAALAVPDGMEDSYRSFYADILDYNTNEATTVNATDFEAEYGVTLASADAKFDKFFGFDSDYSLKSEYGLGYGNRHMTLDPDGVKDADTTDDIHFIGIELSQSNNSMAWAEEIIKKSIEENPEKPIFVITHYKTAGTSLIGAQSSTITRLGDLLSKYPQTFVWGGHNHTFLHADRAIDTSKGYVATDSAVTAYASMSNLTFGNHFGENSNGDSYAANAATKENHAYGNGAFVEVDKDFNVRINRIDLYRSFSADYAKNTSLFSSDEFTKFESKASFAPTDKAVFIREPWDITDIGPEGIHLEDYTPARFEKSSLPYFKDSSSLKVETNKIGFIPVEFKLNATDDDGMVYMYLLELTKKGETEVLQRYYYTNKFYDYPDANIPAIDLTYTFTGLAPDTTYVVSLVPVDDLMNRGVALTAESTTLDGDTKITLEDGKIAVLVDTTGENTTYKWTDGKTYFVYGNLAEASSSNPDVVYIIKGDMNLYLNSVDDTKKFKSGIKFIGLDRDAAVFHYNASYTLSKDMWFENVSLAKDKTGDTGITLQGKTLTLVDVLASADALNIFNSGWGGNDPSGTLVVKGDTGKIANIFPGPNFGANAGSKGDVSITLDGGTYGTVGAAKAQSGNKIDGNVFITVTGGTYDTVRASSTSANHRITKNAVLKIFGGTIGKVGSTGTTNVDGKDVIILTDAAKSAITTLNKADNQIVITVPDDVTDAIGEATADANGYYTAFAIKQIEGKKSFVNGEAATSVALTAGEEYAITYKTPNAIEFDLNGGEGDVPAAITGNAGDDVTSQMPDGTGVTRENYTFRGWSLNKNADTPDDSFVISADGNIAYAVWKAKEKVTITLNANDGACDVTEVKDFAGAVTALPTATKARSVFLGWAESADAEIGVIDYPVTEPKTLYAIFKDVGTKVIYVDTAYKGDIADGGYFTPFKTFELAIAAAGAEEATVVIKKSGYFNGLGESANTLTITSLDPATGENYVETNNAYFHTDGNNIKRPVTLENIRMYNKSGNGYGFINANGNKLIIGEGVTVVPKGEAPEAGLEAANQLIRIRAGSYNGSHNSTYVVIKSPDVLSGIHAATGKTGVIATSATLVLDEYAEGINLGNDGGTGSVTGNINLIVNKAFDKELKTSLYNLSAIGGAVNYIFNNGAADTTKFTPSISEGITVTKGVYTIKSAEGGKVMPTETAGTFEITTTTGEIYINNTAVALAQNNLYALGEAGTYTVAYDNKVRSEVKYDLNGVEGTAPAAYVAKEGDEVILPALGIELEGLTFLGWNTDKDATAALTSLTMGKEPVTLYAIFKKAEYEVAFDSGIGKAVGELAPMTKVHGEDLTLPTDYILYGTGLEFAGWSENPDATAEEVVTAYTGNAATTFFAIYNNVGTAGVTPEDAIDGAYYVITESDDEVTAPEFEIPGTVTEVAKYDITLIDAATGDKLQPAGEISFKVTCDGIDGKAVYVYHVEEDAFEACTVTGNEVTFTTDTLSTFVIYTVEVKAQYKLVGQYNTASGFYTVSLYYNGEEANSGSFGFEYDDSVYTAFAGFEYADGIGAVIPTVREGNVITGTWYPTEGAYIGGDDEDVLIGTFTLTCLETVYDKSLAAERFYVYTGAEADDETFNGQYYLYAPNAESSLEVVFAPIVAMDIVDLEPVTVTYAVTGTLVTVREDGKAPVAPAKAVVTNAGGAKVAEFAIEDASTAVGKVGFEFECAPGTYKLSVIKNGYLEETVEFTVEGDMNIGEIAPTAGDIRGKTTDAQGDGVIDLADFVRILRGFEAAELAAHVDINEDGAVNVTDLGYVKASFGKTK